LHFSLYEKTGNRHYLLLGLNMHDGNLYSRMRLRMDYQNSLHFADVPQAMLNEEKRHKERMQQALLQHRGGVGTLANYQSSLNDWNTFLQRLEKEYPHYHRLRYAEKSLDLDRLDRLVNEGMTIVHYLF